MKITEVLSNEEIQNLTEPSNWRGLVAVGATWGMIAGSLAIVAMKPAWYTIVPAMVLLGGRHLALAILMHDASHNSLFRTRALNQVIGQWLCAYPTWQDLRRYKDHHWLHHKWAGSEKDPDLDLVAPFPITRASMIRKLIRDIIGISGIKRLYGLVAMDLGFIKYTVSAKTVPIDQTGRKISDIVAKGWRNLHGVLITNLVIYLILHHIGKPWLYLLWIGSWLTTFSVIVRIRSIAEHACTQMDLDPMKSTRTTLATPLARVTVAPHRVNYHLEHHLLMTAPYFSLPKIHKLLTERGALKGAYVFPGYLEVLKVASSKRT